MGLGSVTERRRNLASFSEVRASNTRALRTPPHPAKRPVSACESMQSLRGSLSKPLHALGGRRPRCGLLRAPGDGVISGRVPCIHLHVLAWERLHDLHLPRARSTNPSDWMTRVSG